jgi:heptosyltransferase-3
MEKAERIKQVPEEQLLLFPTLHNLAYFVFESGSMIGNDSGIEHLASALKIPTLNLFTRKSYSQYYGTSARGGGTGHGVATPPNLLPGSWLKQKYRKHLLSIRTRTCALITQNEWG